MERQEGYYWVKLTSISKWEMAYFSLNVGWSIEGRHYAQERFHKISETRTPAPDDILETEDSILGLLETVHRLALAGIDFRYDAKSQVLAYNAPGSVRIIATSGGFTFTD